MSLPTTMIRKKTKQHESADSHEMNSTVTNHSVKLEKNEEELNALSKPTKFNHINKVGDSFIVYALRRGRISVVENAIEEIGESGSLDELDFDGFAALHHTTRYCRLDATKKLLENGANVNVQSRDDLFTPLHIAARFGWDGVCDILIQHGADPSQQTVDGLTALHLACRQGSLQIVELLLKQPGIDVNAKDKNQKTPLYGAVSQGYPAIVDLLLENDADVIFQGDETPLDILYAGMSSSSVGDSADFGNIALSLMKKVVEMEQSFLFETCGMSGVSILHVAAASTHIKVAKIFLELGGDINMPNPQNQRTALHYACKKGSLAMVTFLIDSGADKQSIDMNGQTPLHHAAELGHDDIVKFLIDTGADVDARDNTHKTPFLLMCCIPKSRPSTAQILIDKGADFCTYDDHMKNCLHLAIESGNCDILEFFLENVANVEALYCTDIDERVPLHYAAECSNPKALHLLLAKQKRLNFKDSNQQTALFCAAKNNYVAHVLVLGRAGASVFEKGDEAKTALHVAAENGNKKVCRALIVLGAEVNIKDAKQKTPLMYAAVNGCVKTTKALLDLNAAIDDSSVDGKTALLFAIQYNKCSVVELLLDRGADVNHTDNSGDCLLETAAKFSAKDCVRVICAHERWKEFLKSRSSSYATHPMQLLIKHFPEAANDVLNKCISRSVNITPTHPDYTVTYDFELLDPGPDDPGFIAGHRYFGPQTMVKYEREKLLRHPLTQMLLDRKWNLFGSKIYYIGLLMYIWFLVSYTYFVVKQREFLPERRNETDVSKIYHTEGAQYGIAVAVVVFAVFQVVKELVQIVIQRKKYFKQPENLIEWMLYPSCLLFLLPFVTPASALKWVFGKASDQHRYMWVNALISIMLSYINAILFLRRFALFGIYINMFLVVLRSVLKVMLVFMEFLIAFAVVFYILFKEQASFKTMDRALARTIVMALGEIDFTSTFVDSIDSFDKSTRYPLNPLPEFAFFFGTMFVYIICITLMNLLIGLAIGDIDSVQRRAEFQRLAMQVEYVAEIEEKYPRFITRRMYDGTAILMPNKKTFYKRSKAALRNFQSFLKDLTEVTGEETPTEQKGPDVNNMATTLEKNRRQIKALAAQMEAQNQMLREIAEKLNTTEE